VSGKAILGHERSVSDTCIRDTISVRTHHLFGDTSATLGRSQDVCKGARSLVDGERCVISSRSLFKRLDVNEEEEKDTTSVWHTRFVLDTLCTRSAARISFPLKSAWYVTKLAPHKALELTAWCKLTFD